MSGARFAQPGLGGAQRAAAGMLQAAWDAGGGGLGPLFGTLGTLADAGGGGYSAALGQLAPNAAMRESAHQAERSQSFANTLLSCPEFEGATSLVVEGQCAWLRTIATQTNASAQGGTAGSVTQGMLLTLGGQTRVGGNWFVSGGFGIGQDWTRADGGNGTASSQSVYGGSSLKYDDGPWLFSGSV